MNDAASCEVLSFVNEPYLALLDIWMRQSASHTGGAPTIICTDDSAFAHCASLSGVNAERASDRDWSSRPAFWKSRFALMHARVTAGTTFVHTDLDAFWLSSPWARLSAAPDDLVFSREFGLPKRLVPKWGFVLCCGFFRANATPGTHAFFRLWHTHVDKHGDDQFALNMLLDELGVVWEETSFGDHVAHRCIVEVEGERVSILSLPYKDFSREPPFLSCGEAVAHTFFEKRYFSSFMSLYGRCLDRDGRLDAIAIPATLLAEAPSDMKSRDVATLHMLRETMTDDDADPAMWNHRAALELRYGNPAPARHAIEKGLALAPTDPLLLMDAADIYLRADMKSAARSCLLKLGTPSADTPGDTLRLRLRQLKAMAKAGMFAELAKRAASPAYLGEGLRALPRALRVRSMLN